jgi:hypothetical protein
MISEENEYPFIQTAPDATPLSGRCKEKTADLRGGLLRLQFHPTLDPREAIEMSRAEIDWRRSQFNSVPNAMPPNRVSKDSQRQLSALAAGWSLLRAFLETVYILRNKHPMLG